MPRPTKDAGDPRNSSAAERATRASAAASFAELDTFPGESKADMKARAMKAQNRRLLSPLPGDFHQGEARGDLRATGIPPGMEGQLGQGEQPATPEQEQQLNQAVTKMRQMVHGRQSRDHVIDQLNDRNVPIQEAAGRTAANIVGTIQDQAEASGVKLDGDLLVQLGMHTVDELLDVGIAGGFYKLKEGSPELQRVAEMAMLEGAKAMGNKLLASPKAGKHTEDAQNAWAHQVANEVDSGTADPRYLAMTRPQGGGGGGERALLQGGEVQ